MATARSTRRITVLLPDDLVQYVDRRAEEMHTSRSQVIRMALLAVKLSQEEQSAAEGYEFYAVEAAEFASASVEVSSAAWSIFLDDDKTA
jgi:metal-responsive CopG/Arc/MetJ family transcriptional regulator